MKDVIVSIDIGTTKVCTIIGMVNKIGQLEIYGKGYVPCNSVKKGVIVDIEATSEAIKLSVEKAEEEAGFKVGSAYVNIYGLHTTILNEKLGIELSDEGSKTISTDDLDRLYDKFERIPVPSGSQIIDIIPREFVIDGYDSIKDPIGMSGSYLEMDADIIAGKYISVQNIIKSVERAGLEVDGIIMGTYALSELALTPEEMEQGVLLIDVGGGITDISAYKNGIIQMYDSLPVGGEHITNDISIGLNISTMEAEKIKKQYELALTDLIKNDQEISIYDVKEQTYKSVRISQVIEIIEARTTEILSLSKSIVEKYMEPEDLASGIVLTGGGISYLNGCKQIANEVFGLPVRVAAYRSSEGLLKAEYATAAGIIKYVNSKNKRNSIAFSSPEKDTVVKVKKEGFLEKFIGIIRRIFF
ncbi:MAG TPA: cell division protein FtsA [Clostridiaceae bacterium]|nr:cell division protein FtsA [Clostridiaceae bacterium]